MNMKGVVQDPPVCFIPYLFILTKISFLISLFHAISLVSLFFFHAATSLSEPGSPHYGATSLSDPGPPHYRNFTISLRHTTLGRTPLDE